MASEGGWNTIESDAGVFTFLLQKLGAKDVQFEELFSLDSDSLRELSPVYGVIFLFKYPTSESESTNVPRDGDLDYQAAEGLFFANQTIQNACGTQALLSVLLNKDSEIEIGSMLREFKEFTGAFPSDLRGEALSNSEQIRDAHNSFARSSPFQNEVQRPATEDDAVYHFIAYTALNGTLYELDGLQPAPLSHGPCTTDEFPDKIIPVLQRRIARYLRAHNFVGFIGEILKGTARRALSQGGEEGWKNFINEAVERTKKRVEEGRKAGNDDSMDVE